MVDTRTVPTPDMLKRLAPPYGKGMALVHAWDLPTLAGAGGIRSTANDLLRYAQANLKPDDSPLGKAIQFSHRRQGTRDEGKPIAMAWRISANGRTLSHTGATGGYRAWFAVVPGRNLGVVVLGNGADRRIPTFGDRVTVAILKAIATKGTPATPPEPVETEAEEADPAERD
jgi:CubicO group peptidase (beta-lactamase class C family)